MEGEKVTQGSSQTMSLACFCNHILAIIVILDLTPYLQKFEQKVIDP